MLTRRDFLAATALASVACAEGAGGRIGFVDDDPDNFHANTYLRIIRNDLKDRGFEVVGVTALRQDAARAWAEKNNVPYYRSVDELAPHVDYFAVLAPSTPETHLGLCRAVFPHRKPTFVDKTFAPSPTVARELFRLADRYGVAVQTSSALRYTNVQDYVRQVGRDRVRHMVAWGGGRTYDEYAVHPIELVISCMGPEVVRLMRRGTEPEVQLLLDFTGDRTAVINIYTRARTPYAAAVTTRQGTRYVAVDLKTLFVRACAAMLDFFEAGKPLVDRRETMAVMEVIELGRRPESDHRFLPVRISL